MFMIQRSTLVTFGDDKRQHRSYPIFLVVWLELKAVPTLNPLSGEKQLQKRSFYVIFSINVYLIFPSFRQQ